MSISAQLCIKSAQIVQVCFTLFCLVLFFSLGLSVGPCFGLCVVVVLPVVLDWSQSWFRSLSRSGLCLVLGYCFCFVLFCYVFGLHLGHVPSLGEVLALVWFG